MPEFPRFVVRYRRSSAGSQYDYDTLDLQALDAMEFEELIKAAKADQELRRFFEVSDVQAAVNKIEQQMGPTTTVSNTPNCERCGGATKQKTVSTKFGEKTVYECLQQKGECKFDKFGNPSPYPTSKFAPKGRDA